MPPTDRAPVEDSLGPTAVVSELRNRPFPGQSAPPAPVPGYEILAKLGEGGMGVVYHARDLKLGRDVALKVVPAADTLAGSRELVRFLAEAETVASIRHPHVVRVFEYGEHAGRPFLVMEYLAGGTLAERLKAVGRLDPVAAARLVGRAVARGVDAAHAAGVVHRDLKPRNVLFDAAGEPKVTDFGIAKRAASDLTATAGGDGHARRTWPRSRPTGGTKFVGPAADVWALGVILYECLTGRRPFGGGSINSVLYRVVNDDPDPPRGPPPDLPRDLELVCLKCLEKDPHDRYPTAEALADDLDRFARGEPVGVRPAGWGERALRWARRDPARATAYALTAAVVGLVAFGTVAAVLWREAAAAEGFAVAAGRELDGRKRDAEATRDELAVRKAEADAARAAAERQRDAADASRREAEAARAETEAAKREVEARWTSPSASSTAASSTWPTGRRRPTTRPRPASCSPSSRRSTAAGSGGSSTGSATRTSPPSATRPAR